MSARVRPFLSRVAVKCIKSMLSCTSFPASAAFYQLVIDMPVSDPVYPVMVHTEQLEQQALETRGRSPQGQTPVQARALGMLFCQELLGSIVRAGQVLQPLPEAAAELGVTRLHELLLVLARGVWLAERSSAGVP